MLGHSNKYGVRRIAKAIILKLNPGTMEPCDACAAGKSKQKMIKKNRNQKIIREHIFTLVLQL